MWLLSVLRLNCKLLVKTYNIQIMHQIKTIKINELDEFDG